MVDAALGIAAWGLVTGVAMANSGLSVPLAMFMSIVMFSGTAQLAALPLIAAGSPIWVVWVTALCLNLRFVIFSAAWRPYFARLPMAQRMRIAYFAADFNYVYFMRRWPQPKAQPGQIEYYWGGVTVNWLAWQIPSMAGILLGDRVPAHWGLGFAGVMALIGLMGTLLVDRISWVSAAMGGAAAVAAWALPNKLNVVLAIACAVAMGLAMERMPSKARRRDR